MEFIEIGNQKVRIEETDLGEYLSITDLAKLIHNNSGQVINNWVKSVRALEYMNAWELIHNKNYNADAYKEIRFKAGSSSFFLSAGQWIKQTKVIGILLSQKTISILSLSRNSIQQISNFLNIISDFGNVPS